MSHLKIQIEGAYWDSFIYEGRLYLFKIDGSILTINWDALIENLTVPIELRLAVECAFQRSDYLYGKEVQSFFHDSEIRNLMQSKFLRLSDETFHIDHRAIEKHAYHTQDNPFPFPHADCEVYKRELYTVGRSGLTRASVGKTKYPVSTRAHRLWDGPTTRISASWNSLALAAGNEGLFERPIDDSDFLEDSYSEPQRLVDRPCNECNWTFHSIYGSSSDEAFLAAFSKTKFPTTSNHPRHFQRVITDEELWGRKGYSWGVQDKLCLAVDNSIEVLRYEPWSKDPEKHISSLGRVDLQAWKGEIVSASTAQFGVVVELERALVVYPSRGQHVTIRGEPINWRVFPRSLHYKNQLHVIAEDHLEIWSFNHDYLVDQQEKVLGIRVMDRRKKRKMGG